MRAILKKGRVGIHVFLPLQNTYCSVVFAGPNIIHIFSRRFLHFNIFELHSSNIFHFIDKLVSLISCIWQSLYLHVDREVPLGAITVILTHEVLVLPSYWNQSVGVYAVGGIYASWRSVQIIIFWISCRWSSFLLNMRRLSAFSNLK